MLMPTIPDITPDINIDRQDAVNKSIQKTLREVIKTEMLLQFKLEEAIQLDENGDEE